MKTHLLKIGFILGVLTIATTVFTTKLMAFTAVTSGNWSSAATWGGSAPGSNINGQDIIIPNGISVNLDMDVTFSGVISSFTIDGALNSSTNNYLTIDQGTLAGSGTVAIHRLEFHFLSSSTFTGQLTLDVMENSGALLTLTATGTISDTLNLESGSVTLSTGANLAVQTNSTIRVNDGSISIGGGIFDSSNNYDVVYVGSSKNSGIEINSLTIQNVYLQLTDNTQTLTLSSNLKVNGTLNMTMGNLNIHGNDLDLYGNMTMSAGALFVSDASSNILVQTNTTITSAFTFASSSGINIFTIDYTGSGNVKLNSALNISGELRLKNGNLSLETGAMMVMSSGSLIHIEAGDLNVNGGSFNGTASYNVEYMAGTNTTGIEVTGSGLNDLTVNLSSGSNQVNLNSNITTAGNFSLMMGNVSMNGFDLIVNGTIDQSSSAGIIGNINSNLELHITASSNDTIHFDGTNQNIGIFVLDVSGSGNVVVESQLHINSELSMLSGKLIIDDFDLIIEQGATITSYNNVNYIVTSGTGSLQMHVNVSAPYQVFPVGTTTNYSPAGIIQASGGTAGNFKVNVFDGVLTSGTTGFNSATTASVVNRTWLVDAASGVTLNMDLKLGWVLAAEVNGFDRTNCYISEYSTSWDSHATSSAVAGLNSTYEINRSGITSNSPFVVADQNAELKIKEEPIVSGIHLYPNPCTDFVNVSNLNTADQYLYQIIDVAGKIYTLINNGSNQFDVSYLKSGSYLLRLTDLVTNKVSIRKFVKR